MADMMKGHAPSGSPLDTVLAKINSDPGFETKSHPLMTGVQHIEERHRIMLLLRQTVLSTYGRDDAEARRLFDTAWFEVSETGLDAVVVLFDKLLEG